MGRRRIYRLSADGLEPLHAWLSEVTPPQSAEGVWSARFDALDTEVRRTRRDRSRATSTGGSAETSPPETTTPPETISFETTRETA
jgi:DNA-binding PadR family transcriptional regulator